MPNEMLEALSEEDDLDVAIVICLRSDGKVTYHTSTDSEEDVVYELEMMKHKILNGDLG